MAILEDLREKKDRVLSTKGAAAATGFHQTHINKLLATGVLKGTKAENGRWSIKQSDVDEYMKSNKVKPRRPKAFLQKDEDGKPPKSLLTRLDEKDEEIQALKNELRNSKAAYQLLETDSNKDIEDLENALDKKDKEMKTLIEDMLTLKTRNNDLETEIREANQFIRDTHREVLNNVLGTHKQ